MLTAPNTFPLLKSKFKGLFKRSKNDDKPTETTKPTEAAAAQVAAAARKYFAILSACDPVLH